ncbi:MAG: hypothetical protein H0U95_13045 [Bacteroidetes bacterium]|nr:hypothetical protein [Bacteroidota bacterium]
MRNKEKEEIALINIDRNPLVLILSIGLSTLLDYLAYSFILDLIPWGFVLLIPAVFLSFQTIWLLLTPYAMLFDDKLEIKRTLFSNKMLFFADVKKVGNVKKGSLFISYNDDEVAKISLFGIKTSQVNILRSELEKHVTLTLNKRP